MNVRKFGILFAFVMLLLPAVLSGQQTSYVHDSRFPFIIITKDTVEQAPVLSDEEFYRTSKGVIFQVNRTEIPATDNFMKLYRDSVLPWINASHLQLRKVFIRGAASPEGSYANNQRLGNERSQALLRELRRNLSNQYIETDADISSVTEDYGYLCLLMKEANDPDYQLVKDIYDGCNGDEQCCKQRLQEAKNKSLWPRLLREYFPRLRSARFVLWFSEPDSVHAPVPPLDVQSTQSVEALTIQPIELQHVAVKLPEVKVEWEGGLPIAVDSVYTRRHMIAVRTNLVHDFFYMPRFGWAFSPNIQFEYYPKKGHLTYNIGMTWGTDRKWDTQEFWQVRDIQAELRRYFKGGGKFIGLYLGAYIHGDKYGIGLDAKEGWEGEGGGAGLSLGYTTRLNRKGSLRFEVMAAAGFFLTIFDPYVYGNPITGTINGKYYYNYHGTASKFKERNHRFTWLGPTNLGIQLTYDIIYRRRTQQAP